MTRFALLLVTALALSACSSGNPFDDEDTDTGGGTGTGGGTDTGGSGIDSNGLPPGTTNPTPDNSLFRREATGNSDSEYFGNGFASGITYDAATDSFNVDGLAFDGEQPNGNRWTRSTPGSLGPLGGQAFAVYEAPLSVPDSLTGTPVPQFNHRAIFGVSTSGETEFAVVRTGAYAGYGFGGFVYQRNGDVVLPDSGQAIYRGSYAGLRDFNGAGGLEYTTGNMSVQIDFEGFNGNCTGSLCGNAISGTISNRTIYDSAGFDITSQIVAAINEEYDVNRTTLPVINFLIGPNAMTVNGEATGQVNNSVAGEEFEAGNYYLIMSGDHTATPGGEIVGIVVVESDDPRFENVTARETGGFIVYRQ